MNRFKAFGVHLAISLAIFAVLAYVILYWWYPDFFFSTDGGWQGIRIIAFVDLVLGPVLTLIVFNPKKKELKTDLTLIGLFQMACLTAGVYIVYSERPLAMVMVDNHFYTMSADDYAAYDVEVPDLSEFPGRGPKWVSILIPEDPAEASKIRAKAYSVGKPIRVFSEHYQAFENSQIDKSGFYPHEKVREREHISEVQYVPAWLEEHGGGIEEYGFYPLGTRYRYIFFGCKDIRQRDTRRLGNCRTTIEMVPERGIEPRTY